MRSARVRADAPAASYTEIRAPIDGRHCGTAGQSRQYHQAERCSVSRHGPQAADRVRARAGAGAGTPQAQPACIHAAGGCRAQTVLPRSRGAPEPRWSIAKRRPSRSPSKSMTRASVSNPECSPALASSTSAANRLCRSRAPPLSMTRGQASVFVVEGGKAQQRHITVGLTNDGLVEITTGLKGQEQVVVVRPGRPEERQCRARRREPSPHFTALRAQPRFPSASRLRAITMQLVDFATRRRVTIVMCTVAHRAVRLRVAVAPEAEPAARPRPIRPSRCARSSPGPRRSRSRT